MTATPASPAPSPGASIVPVILSGGTGTRLWPVSRESFPKQLWPLVSDRTMLQETALRGVGPDFARPIVVCNNEHRFLIAEQLRAAGIADAEIVLEPVGRNSAPAITAAALLASEADPNAVLWMMAADAAIHRTEALHAALERAVVAAHAGRIVMFGMQPHRAETAYGYIEVGPELSDAPGVHDLVRFVEKPDAATAARLVAAGDYLWNSGMFVFTAATLLAEMERHAPEVLAAVRRAVAGRVHDLDFTRLDAAAFTACPNISLDYAVAERTSVAAVVPADLGWSDVGSWDALWEQSAKDADGNAIKGDVLLEGSENCYVRSDGVLTAVVGLQDVVVVVTGDAVLAMHRDRAQDVKRVVDRLRKDGRHEAVAHNRVYRPWGFYESLIHSDRFQVKRIVVSPGHRLSLQKHFHRAEHWVVVSGSALVTRDADEMLVRENESVYLPLGCTHRLANPGRIPLTLIEVQSGSYLGEDDIVRFEDTYGRI
jgi:mannose-1-phosphate guanylyltransferase/mannose-6-phosphate isomerase